MEAIRFPEGRTLEQPNTGDKPYSSHLPAHAVFG
jgi:hypothetical protein